MKINDIVPDFRQECLSHSDINSYLDSLAAKYPNLCVVKQIGYSFEKRPLKSIHISKSIANENDTKPMVIRAKSSVVRNVCAVLTESKQNIIESRPKTKPVILVDGGMHAREWLTISTALNCASQLTDNHEANADLLDAFDFVIVPIVNADGYEYSRTNKKMWRKSRRPILYSKFVGVDFNRNFSLGWETACERQSSCTFRGEKPFSEPETRIVKHLMHSLGPKFYLTLHSYSKSIMFPYAYTSLPPKNVSSLYGLAKAGHLAIKKATGTKFRIGSVSSMLKNSRRKGGGSLDYAYGRAKIPFVIAMELSGGCFQPPANAINEIICESWIGIHAMCSFLKSQKLK